jgi:chromosome segregation ATPase
MDHLKKQTEELTYVKKLRNDLQHKLEDSEKFLDHARYKILDYEKKIEKLEKRLELILETDIGTDKDKMRRALTELVKENEDLKRKDYTANKELKKSRDEMTKMKSKFLRQNKKIEYLLKKKGVASVNTDEMEKNLFNNLGNFEE